MTGACPLLDWRQNPVELYPTHAGSKGGGASRLAADKITYSGAKESIERRVMRLFLETGKSYTADEVASKLGVKTKNARPRLSELCLNKTDKNGRVTRPKFLNKSQKIIDGASEDGAPQHVYERIS